MTYEVGEVLHRGRTDFQDLVIYTNPTFRRLMALDGVTQTTEGDEFVYHETMSHVPLFAQGHARRVHVLGRGDRDLLRRVPNPPVRPAGQVQNHQTHTDTP